MLMPVLADWRAGRGGRRRSCPWAEQVRLQQQAAVPPNPRDRLLLSPPAAPFPPRARAAPSAAEPSQRISIASAHNRPSSVD